MGAAKPFCGARRARVAESRLAFSPFKPLTNCFGYMARERGQSRVPEPPDRMTGTIRIGMDNVSKKSG
jgi:hypothetical protein